MSVFSCGWVIVVLREFRKNRLSGIDEIQQIARQRRPSLQATNVVRGRVYECQHSVDPGLIDCLQK
jgi:hypothetical protein